MDMQQLMNDADRAALNHKFEYHKAKRLNAAERGTQIHEEIERALAGIPPAHVVSGEIHAGAKLRALIDGQNAMLQETADDIRAQHNPQLDWYRDPMVTMITPEEPRPSILKLALSLTARFLLVLGVAVLVLAMVTK